MVSEGSQLHPQGPFGVFNRTLNGGLVAMLRTPRVHHVVSHFVAEISVTGRRSGRTISLPVFFRQRGDVVRIHVAMAKHKLWWRNLSGAGAPVVARLRGQLRSGHGQVELSKRGGVIVVVSLDDVSANR